MAKLPTPSAVKIKFDENATIDDAIAALRHALGRAGCTTCGRLQLIDIGLVRETPGLALKNVVHFEEIG